MPDNATPERVTNRVITSAQDSERFELGSADLSLVGLEAGDDVKVVTYDSHIELIPGDDS